jgi:hypothetical protein
LGVVMWEKGRNHKEYVRRSRNGLFPCQRSLGVILLTIRLHHFSLKLTFPRGLRESRRFDQTRRGGDEGDRPGDNGDRMRQQGCCQGGPLRPDEEKEDSGAGGRSGPGKRLTL